MNAISRRSIIKSVAALPVADIRADAQREGNDDAAYTMRRVADEIARNFQQEPPHG